MPTVTRSLISEDSSSAMAPMMAQVNARGDKGRVPENGKDFVAGFRAASTSGAAAVDRGFPENTSLTIDAS